MGQTSQLLLVSIPTTRLSFPLSGPYENNVLMTLQPKSHKHSIDLLHLAAFATIKLDNYIMHFLYNKHTPPHTTHHRQLRPIHCPIRVKVIRLKEEVVHILLRQNIKLRNSTNTAPSATAGGWPLYYLPQFAFLI